MATNAKNNTYLFCDLPSRTKPLENWLDPLLDLLPEDTREIIAPNGIFDTPRKEAWSFRSIFCCRRANSKREYEAVQFTLSDRRCEGISDGMFAGNPTIPWTSIDVLKGEPMWCQPWDAVTVTERPYSVGATLWQPLGMGHFIWTHIDLNERMTTGYGCNLWDAEGKHLYLQSHCEFEYGDTVTSIEEHIQFTRRKAEISLRGGYWYEY